MASDSGGGGARPTSADSNLRLAAQLERARAHEASQRGPGNLASEQVANRAYPRGYVDDRQAQQSRQAFDSTAQQSDRGSYPSSADYDAAQSESRTGWQALGPVTPNVPGVTTEFLDPTTRAGPATQESGRVAALAMDPNCGKNTAPASAPCRLWVATAGGGIWRTNEALATKPTWVAPPDNLPTNAFGSLVIDPNDPSGNTLYAGSGEPGGSSDMEAGLGLFRSTDGGGSWQLITGSRAAAFNRSITTVVVQPGDPSTIWIGTSVARHGASSVFGGEITPPNAPALGVYKSTDGGNHFTFEADLRGKTPPSPNLASREYGLFPGGINKLALDPADTDTIYASVHGYGLWCSSDGGGTWAQVFHPLNQTDNASGKGDTIGDRTDFDIVAIGGGRTRIYLGDGSSDLVTSEVWRIDDAAAIRGDPSGNYDNGAWTKLSDETNGTPGFLPFNYCEYACWYSNVVTSPASQLGMVPGQENTVWLGGIANFDELPLYPNLPSRSNGRSVMRSTNAGDRPSNINWNDMTATLGGAPSFQFTRGLHVDQHAVVFAPRDPGIAFVGSDGGIVRVDVRKPQNKSAACSHRRFAYTPGGAPEPLQPPDLLDCQRLLSGIPQSITPLNDGLNDLQFQSLSFNPQNPTGDVLGGTQDNGTFAYSGSTAWLEIAEGDGGQSGFDAADPTIRYHNFSGAFPQVNRHSNDPRKWLSIYDPLQASGESSSFYIPFIADPVVGGRAFTGLQHVWRTNDNGGDPAYLVAHCGLFTYSPSPTQPCGDWQPLGPDLTDGGPTFGGDRAGGDVAATERAPSERGTLWAATKTGRLFVSKNAGAAPGDVLFNRIDGAGTPSRFVSGIAIDPSDPNHAWISYNGYGSYTPDTPQHVLEARYNAVQRRATFVDLSFDLGDQPVTGIRESAATGAIYVGTDFGVLRLPHGGTRWHVAGAGLPKVAVYGLSLSQQGHVLYAATHGRGAWRLDLPGD